MPRLDCREKMRAALAAVQQWGREHAATFALDVRPECSADWTADYAIIELELDSVSGEPYVDGAQALADVRTLVQDAIGSAFKVEYGLSKGKVARTPGDLVCVFHRREVEIYRVTEGATA